ncbi:response regulator [Tamlana sp. 62-3]|uniref:histidine kinase n=1 Tax=Neotamlana sargassicola TaxID=2883125 RepID=A0A9X1L8K9_9FLAO|nr:ATP-binding protein [Tamlana sargassicola]MCB4809614.1 response regulator [Tamlana sargassicola]
MFSNLKKRTTYVPLVIFLLFLLIVFVLWQRALNSVDASIDQNISQVGNLISKEFKNIVKSDISRLENLRSRVEYTDGSFFNYWQRDATSIVNQNRSFQFVEWIDSTMTIRKITPLKGNEAAINLDLSDITYRYEEWLKHINDSTTNITNWVDLRRGGSVFLVDVPIFFDDKFHGTITGGVNFKKSFDKFTTNLNNFYAIEIFDHTNTPFYNLNLNKKLNHKGFETNILVDSLHNKKWRLKVYPSTKFSSSGRRSNIHIALLIALLFCVLTALLSHFYLKVKMQTKIALVNNTRLVNTNNKLNKERKKAEKASLAKTEFLSNMSHEIRTPLHAILGFIELLKESNLNKTDKEYLDLMEKSSSNLLNIVNDILDMDKIESGKIELSEVKFNPYQNVKDLIEVNQFIFLRKALYLKAEYKTVNNFTVLGDESKFIQIVNNIIKNGLKFTTNGGVSLTYSEKVIKENKLHITIEIKDTGIGIPKNHLESIFERFKQIDNSVKKQYEGSGLGLAISKIFINMMGGDIKVKSTVEKGTTFIFDVVFPIISEHSEKSTESITKSSSNSNLCDLNVLIVDDNNLNIIVLKKFLESYSIKADIANNGLKAVETFKQNRNYDLIFMDIHMPIMDGWEASKEIRKIDKDVIIFGLSANVTTQAIDLALENGMNNYLSKPFKKEHIVKLLQFHFSH